MRITVSAACTWNPSTKFGIQVCRGGSLSSGLHVCNVVLGTSDLIPLSPCVSWIIAASWESALLSATSFENSLMHHRAHPEAPSCVSALQLASNALAESIELIPLQPRRVAKIDCVTNHGITTTLFVDHQACEIQQMRSLGQRWAPTCCLGTVKLVSFRAAYQAQCRSKTKR